MTPQFEIILIACTVSVACVIPGVFLILRGISLMSDAISHAVLLGIVLSFFVIKDLDSPLLILGASLSGVLTVALTELLIQSRLVKKDAAIGLVFPVFFSLGVILINQGARDIHLDTDAVLLGELAFAPFNRLFYNGIDFGPQALWTMGVILALNFLFIFLFYKELKLATFDEGLAKTLGFSPVIIHYGLMTMTSVTAVGAFDVVGSILVVALMVTPAATAYLLTVRLERMIGLAVLFGLLSAIFGYGLAYILDASIAGSMATMTGVFFLITLMLSPSRGLVFLFFKSKRQRLTFSMELLSVQLYEHEGSEQEAVENTLSNTINHMEWAPKFAKQVVIKGAVDGVFNRQGDALFLTPLGRELAKSCMARS